MGSSGPRPCPCASVGRLDALISWPPTAWLPAPEMSARCSLCLLPPHPSLFLPLLPRPPWSAQLPSSAPHRQLPPQPCEVSKERSARKLAGCGGPACRAAPRCFLLLQQRVAVRWHPPGLGAVLGRVAEGQGRRGFGKY